ncbi:MAG: hypothetical protein EXR72_08385 [Myxococcales bacterium]|nr:hypothetical protein [Myxococcales bacterium]
MVAERSLLFTALGLIVGTLAVGVLGTALGMSHVSAAVAVFDPSMKATLLARGVSEAMNCTLLALGAVPLWLAPFVVGVIRGGGRR